MPTTQLLPDSLKLSTTDYDEFCEIGHDFFNNLDMEQVAFATSDLTTDDFEWHPGGFIVAREFGGKPHDEDGGLRLHIWPPGIDRQESDIHAHPWNLAALVIAGTYVETQPLVTQTEVNSTHRSIFSYNNPDKPGEITQIDNGLVEVTPQPKISYHSGQVHTIEAGVYHHTPIKNNSMLVTLALIGSQLHRDGFFLRSIDHEVSDAEPARQPLADGTYLNEAFELIRSM